MPSTAPLEQMRTFPEVPHALHIRVLVVHPSAELYGSDRVLVESVTGLIEAGAEVTVSLPADGVLLGLLRSVGAEVTLTRTVVLRKNLLSIRGMLKLVGNTIAGSVAGLRLIRSFKPDVILVNTLTIPLWIYLGRISGVPVVAHVHEAEGSARPWVARILAAPLRRAQEVVVNSEYSLSVLEKADPTLAGRGIVIYNAVSGPADFTRPRAQLSGAIRLLYVGRISERKGVEVLIRALSIMRSSGVDARLDIVGAVFSGYEWFETRLENLVHELGLERVVRFQGFHDSVWPFLRESDIAVVPSTIDEPFGNTAVEAILAARPVIVSETSGLREAARGYRSTRFVPPSDPDAIALAVEDLIASWSEVREGVLRDREVALRRHDPRGYRSHIVNIVRSLAPERDASPIDGSGIIA
jgi:glycosyltransferase involved in cell wall biosynthesis